ncbi:MAG: S1C family serine protease [Pirellulales bacterium]
MRPSFILYLLAIATVAGATAPLEAATTENAFIGSSLRVLNLETQPKIVKIFGVGGLRQLEAYQTGVFVSPEGHILTAQSLVLDEGEVTAVLWNGIRVKGTVVAVEPLLELALLKIDVDEPVEWFPLQESISVKPGMRVLAFANVFGIAVYDEPVSMLQGVVSGIVPLSARRGASVANYTGNVYVVDAATNNPGAAGGAVVDLSGRFLGLIGKEMRSESTGAWLNYVLPASALREPVERMKAGKPPAAADATNLASGHPAPSDYGIVLVTDLFERTPPYVDRVVVGSLAAQAGIRPDDLIVGVGEQTVGSRRDLEHALATAEADKPLQLRLLRGKELLHVSLEQDNSQADGNE